MAILAECPICHRKQTTKKKVCKCGQDLDKAKKSKRVRYWISYRLPNGQQRRESVASFEGLNPHSIEDARDAESKRKVQRREKRIFEMLPGENLTFAELAEWYLNLDSVKQLATHQRVEGCIYNFNKVFGNQIVSTIKPVNLESYQSKREAEGKAPATIDMELVLAQAMVTKGFDNDKVDGRSLKAFRKLKKKLTKGANARKRTMTLEEYLLLTTGKHEVKWKLRSKEKQKVKDISPSHLKAILIVAFHTGMRRGELLTLRWSYIDRENKMIRFPSALTKEGKKKRIPKDSALRKNIPINYHVEKALSALPRALHHDYVFTYLGKPISKLRRSFENACKNAGIPYGRKVENGLTFHDIRASFDTNMDRAGVRESSRKIILGHTLEGMDAHYIRSEDEDLNEAMEKYTSWFDDQLSNVDHSVDQVLFSGESKKLSY